MLAKLRGGYEDAWKGIIRPPRDDYNMTELGSKEFGIDGKRYKRSDITLKNKAGLNLECSHFEPVDRIAQELPCVIYLHGNSSSRIEALPAGDLLLPLNITLFCFDFSGSGKSEGEYISLGWHEKEDLETVISYLRSNRSVSAIGLWGRGMGAVTALLHAERDPTIAGMVMDSAFSDLSLLTQELASAYSGMPKFIVSSAMSFMRKTIQNEAKFDINDLSPIKSAKSGFIPALFVAGKDDKYVLPHHTQKLFKVYSGDKNLILVDGDSHSIRPQFLLDSIAIFFFNILICEHLPKDIAAVDLLQKTKLNIEEAVPNLAQSYIKHNQKREDILRVENEKLSSDVIEGFGDEDDEVGEKKECKELKESINQLIQKEMVSKNIIEVTAEIEIDKIADNQEQGFIKVNQNDDEYEFILSSPRNSNLR